MTPLTFFYESFPLAGKYLILTQEQVNKINLSYYGNHHMKIVEINGRYFLFSTNNYSPLGSEVLVITNEDWMDESVDTLNSLDSVIGILGDDMIESIFRMSYNEAKEAFRTYKDRWHFDDFAEAIVDCINNYEEDYEEYDEEDYEDWDNGYNEFIDVSCYN